MTAPKPVLESVTFTADAPGPGLLILGGVHGDEHAGPVALQALMDAGGPDVARGRITLAPRVNVAAMEANTRYLDVDLNRVMFSTPDPALRETLVADALRPLIDQHEWVVDLHAFKTGKQPFILMGPENNDGPLEPFSRQEDEENLTRATGIETVLYGWYRAQAQAIEHQTQTGGTSYAKVPLSAGVTEYARSIGAASVTVECGPKADPASADIAADVIARVIAFHNTGVLPAENAQSARRVYRVAQNRMRADAQERLWREDVVNFTPVQAGDPLVVQGEDVVTRAENDGLICFPSPKAPVGANLYSFLTPSPRLSP